jgi:tetratricopeptide (TPR) repeat protein
MAPKKASVSKGRKSKAISSSSQEFDDANDYVEAADEFESAMRKWRAGDAEKSLRFYNRALAVYEEGLKKFPKDFDLAYNKANLQYLVATDTRLLKHIVSTKQATEIDLLQQSLDSHRYALQLDQGNAEILFNTATVLTSLGEKFGDSNEEEQKWAAIRFLQEAIELFSSCLTRQEYDLEQFQTMQEEAQAVQDPSEESIMEESESKVADSGDLAEVVEAITPNTLIETALAEMSTITTLITMVSSDIPGHANISSTLASLSELGFNILNIKLPAYMDLLSKIPVAENRGPPVEVRVLSVTTSKVEVESNTPSLTPFEEARKEIAIISVTFQSSLASAEFSNKLTSYGSYATRLQSIFESVDVLKEETSPEFLLARANAYDDLAAAILISDVDRDIEEARTVAWIALTMAEASILQGLEDLSQKKSGAKLISKEPSKAGLYLLGGDVALHQQRLVMAAADPSPDEKSNELFAKAFRFYTEALHEASNTLDEDMTIEASVKKLLVESGGNISPTTFAGLDLTTVNSIIQDMADEGLIQKAITF